MRPRVGRVPEREGSDAHVALGQKLRELPSELPPPFDWTELERRALAASRSRPTYRRLHAGRRVVMVAGALAGVVVALVAAAVVARLVRGSADERASRQAGEIAAARDSARSGAMSDPEPVLRRAAAAEHWLADRPDDEPVVRVSTYLVVTDLEDRIASVDDLLNAERLQNQPPSHVRALQLERARLVDSLAQVRYAEMLATELP